MRNMSARGQKWLKSIHVLFACLWVGGAIALTVMNFTMHASDGMELYGINLSMKLIDDFIIIPGAVGLLLTGLIYSAFTNWGWFKNTWVVVKWIINLFGVIFGTFWLGPWLNAMPVISKTEGLASLINPVYSNNVQMLRMWGTLQTATIVFAVFVSILKPWKRRKS